jgi:dihydrofolate reductase
MATRMLTNGDDAMGEVYSYLYMSLDGVISQPERWVGPYFDEALAEDLTTRLEKCHSMVLGRNTYEIFASYWPHQGSDVPFADLNNSVRKLVVSSTLDKTDWNNSQLTDVNGLIAARREGDLHITGSGDLVRSLITIGRLDALMIQLIPVMIGSGQRIFDGGAPTGLTLAAQDTHSNGVISLTYRPTER